MCTMVSTEINSFRGKYAFLSNFYACDIFAPTAKRYELYLGRVNLS